MAWTEERVNLLKKLWAEGLSASQIAAEMGGVTRNAVIGKVHRLNLPGREKPPSQRAIRRAKAAKTRAQQHMAGTNNGNFNRYPESQKRANAAAAQETAEEMTTQPPQDEAVVEPKTRKLRFEQLSETTCKWPIGDPLEKGFHFCGCKTEVGSPYCQYHSEMAFQPGSNRSKAEKRKRTAVGLRAEGRL